jgi:hypothetical protein
MTLLPLYQSQCLMLSPQLQTIQRIQTRHQLLNRVVTAPLIHRRRKRRRQLMEPNLSKKKVNLRLHLTGKKHSLNLSDASKSKRRNREQLTYHRNHLSLLFKKFQRLER